MFGILDNFEVFLEEPNRSVHIREYANLMKISPSTALKYLNRFAAKGLAIKKRERNTILYRANTDSNLYHELKKFHNVIKIQEKGLVKFLEEEFNQPEAIILFGSYAHATNDKQSDIDICVISPKKNEINLTEFEKKLHAPIQLFVFSKVEFKSGKQRELFNNIINGVVLKGFLEVF